MLIKGEQLPLPYLDKYAGMSISQLKEKYNNAFWAHLNAENKMEELGKKIKELELLDGESLVEETLE